MNRIDLEVTRSGLPAAWEKGGAGTNTGDAQIISDARGEAPVATYIKTRGSLSCAEHALVIVKPGMFIIRASQHRGDFRVRVLKLVAIHGLAGKFEADVEEVSTFDQAEWVPPLPPMLTAAVEAAKKKACSYHCRSVFFAREKAKQPTEEPNAPK